MNHTAHSPCVCVCVNVSEILAGCVPVFVYCAAERVVRKRSLMSTERVMHTELKLRPECEMSSRQVMSIRGLHVHLSVRLMRIALNTRGWRARLRLIKFLSITNDAEKLVILLVRPNLPAIQCICHIAWTGLQIRVSSHLGRVTEAPPALTLGAPYQTENASW